MNIRPGAASLLTVFLLICGVRLEAHHSFGAEYDAEGKFSITLKGVITKIEWANPHCHFYMDVTDPGGKVTNWKFEGYPPNVLARTGFKVSGRNAEDRGFDYSLRLAGAERDSARARARIDVRERSETLFRTARGYR